MLRAGLKWSAQFAFGRAPGGARLYRALTRDHLGTQATHVDKLKRVWPGYVEVWRDVCGLELDGLDVWIHDGGWTPFPLLVNYITTGKAGTVTNHDARILDRYLARAVNGAMTCPIGFVPVERLCTIEALRWAHSAEH